MSTFALVHGAWHGSWCWEALTLELRSAGHDVVTVDLPSDQPSASFVDYATAVVRALDRHSDDVVLVGHSMAGQTIPLVAEQRPLRRLVYVCALLPAPGRSLRDQFRDEPDMFVPGSRQGVQVVDDHGTTRWADVERARYTLYGDCTEEDARAATARLRPQATTPYSDVCALQRLPDTPATYVLCAEDRLVNPDWSRRRAALQGIPVVELPGGHSPFLSRPGELSRVLTAVLQTSLGDT
jgi:pimeloyl-ACP methyl ester carboxylesterase